ncbi:uncharacterized protein LOC108114889 [Drosophila eugracilis]|uniref:uncharacterized protein LOC108114889 n=1 Tax=Drosophila eugracilis TaxID=29029 RepID=UPI001BDB2FBF|nr:uncharacterized protein LOC108114889 [Drosophila eugracilis]
MVKSKSTPNTVFNQNELVVNSEAMNIEDLSDLLQLNEEIEERCRSNPNKDSKSGCGLLRAKMTREELFEISTSSSLDDDRFLTALEHQNSYSKSRRVQVTDLDMPSIENLMKYFDEEVPVTPSKIVLTTRATAPNGKVASVIAKLANQSDTITSTKPILNSCHPTISKLKQKYEQQVKIENTRFATRDRRKTSVSLPMKVKEMAHLLNSKISQVIRRSEVSHYVQLQNEISVATEHQYPLTSESQAQGTCLVAEEVFRELSVKDKALLFNKFIADMAATHPKFIEHTAELKAKVDKLVACGEVVAEKQISVKNLAQEFEEKCNLERGSAPQLDEVSSLTKNDCKMGTGTSQLHVSNLSVVLKPRAERKERRYLERRSADHAERSKKRNLAAIRKTLPTEAYAPPKKIRRTRQERMGCDNQLFFQNTHLETLFYNWLSSENGVQYDITSASNSQQTIEIATENTILKSSTDRLEDVSQKSDVERVLEEAIAKIELEKLEFIKSPLTKNVKITPRRNKRMAPPVPAPRPTLSQTHSSASSCKQSEAEDSESGLSTLPKITSDESQPEMIKEDLQPSEFDFVKPQRPPRKKKMRRNLTWKKDNSAVEATTITSTDSDSDYKSSLSAPDKKTTGANCAFPLPEQSLIELDKSFMRQVNSPRKIKSAYTLTVISSPSQNADTNQTPRQSLGQTMRDSFIDQGFETCSNDPIDNSPLRRSFVSSYDSKPSGFSTPVKGRHVCSLAQQQLFSPIFSLDRPGRSSLAMQVIREDHALNLDATPSLPSTPCNEREFFANAPTVLIDSTQDEITAGNPHSMFWIISGDLTVSLKISKYSPERLRLLYDIFIQKSFESRDLAFGIDGHKFTCSGEISKSTQAMPLDWPPSVQDCSHYWFASGDFSVPFSGKLMSDEKIKRLFAFLNAEKSKIRFGVDHIEFSSLPEFCPTTQKYSIESSYSMLVGLQTGASNGLEGRSKYSWPNNSNSNQEIKTNDIDRTQLELDANYFGKDSGGPSFSPDVFSLDYEAVPLDELFANVPLCATVPILSTGQMMQALKQQQGKLSNVEQRIRSYAKPSKLTDVSLERYRNTPQYVHKLRSIIRTIDSIGRDDGFRGCSMQQLESFMYFLSEYANVCLTNCNEHIDKILDRLLDHRAQQNTNN